MSRPERWRIADLAWVALDSKHIAVTPRHGRGVLVLPEPLSAVLQTFTTFQSVDQHLTDATTRFGLDATRVTALRRDLERLAQAGLLLSLRHVEEAARVGVRGPADPITHVAIPTRERPDMVERALRGRAAVDRDRKITYVVVDQTRTQSGREQLRARLASLAATTALDIRYAGYEEKLALSAALTASPELAGINQEALRLGLFGQDDLVSIGANRNCARLLGPRSIACMDDDVTGRSGSISAEEGFALSSEPDPTDLRFYAEDEAAARAAGVEEGDLIVEHERWLGKSAGECLAETPGAWDVDRASAPLLSDIGKAYAAVTSNGIAGDCGMSATGYFLLLRDQNHQRLVADFSRLRRTRSVVRSVPVATLSNGAFFMAPSYCVDERDPLPPFCPVQRNCDGNFAAVMKALDGPALICHLPTSIEHRPGADRTFPTTHANFGVDTYYFPDLMHWSTSSFVPTPRTTIDERKRALARHLRDIGQLNDNAFGDFTRFHRLNGLVGLNRALQRQLDDYGACAEYTAELRSELAAIRKVLSAPWIGFRDLDADATKAAQRARWLLTNIADFFEAWPTILTVARRLAQEGKPLSVSVSAGQ